MYVSNEIGFKYKLLTEIQVDQLTQAIRKDIAIVMKADKNCQIVDFAVPTDHIIILIRREINEEDLDLAKCEKTCGYVLFSSSLLLLSQYFSSCVLQPSSGVCQFG